MEHMINIYGSWRYIEILWSEAIGLCMKLNIIYNIIICNPEPEANESFFWTVETVWLGPKTDEPLVCACISTKHLN